MAHKGRHFVSAGQERQVFRCILGWLFTRLKFRGAVFVSDRGFYVKVWSCFRFTSHNFDWVFLCVFVPVWFPAHFLRSVFFTFLRNSMIFLVLLFKAAYQCENIVVHMMGVWFPVSKWYKAREKVPVLSDETTVGSWLVQSGTKGIDFG